MSFFCVACMVVLGLGKNQKLREQLLIFFILESYVTYGGSVWCTYFVCDMMSVFALKGGTVTLLIWSASLYD